MCGLTKLELKLLFYTSEMNDRLTSTVKKIFEIPVWYLPSETEINRLSKYVRDEGSVRRAKLARILDCSAFCPGTDCYFCMEIDSVFKMCCEAKTGVARHL